MDIEEKVMEALADAGVSFTPSEVEISGSDYGDIVEVKYLEGRPAFDNVFAQLQKKLGPHFCGFHWKDGELSLEVFTDHQSAPDDET